MFQTCSGKTKWATENSTKSLAFERAKIFPQATPLCCPLRRSWIFNIYSHWTFLSKGVVRPGGDLQSPKLRRPFLYLMAKNSWHIYGGLPFFLNYRCFLKIGLDLIMNLKYTIEIYRTFNECFL